MNSLVTSASWVGAGSRFCCVSVPVSLLAVAFLISDAFEVEVLELDSNDEVAADWLVGGDVGGVLVEDGCRKGCVAKNAADGADRAAGGFEN